MQSRHDDVKLRDMRDRKVIDGREQVTLEINRREDHAAANFDCEAEKLTSKDA